jgi:hypothetical protein
MNRTSVLPNIKIRVLYQSTGNLIEHNLKGLQADVALLAENATLAAPTGE